MESESTRSNENCFDREHFSHCSFVSKSSFSLFLQHHSFESFFGLRINLPLPKRKTKTTHFEIRREILYNKIEGHASRSWSIRIFRATLENSWLTRPKNLSRHPVFTIVFANLNGSDISVYATNFPPVR